MKVKDIGEFGLISKLAGGLKPSSSSVVIGIGDDAAVIKTPKDKLLVVTTDTMVEEVHFDLEYSSYRSVGWKALASNISDCAAMGGVSRQAVVTIGLPDEISVKDVQDIYGGIRALARKFSIDIVGGDTVSSPKCLIVSITLLGHVEKNMLVLRSGAKAGDVIMVAGHLGDSSAGLIGLTLKIGDKKLSRKHLLPEPMVKEGRLIAASGASTSMMDNSDGLARCVLEISRMSNVGARIYLSAIPVSKELAKFGRRNGFDPIDLALNGGEDYGLVFTVKRSKAHEVSRLVKQKTGTSVHIVGEIVEKNKGINLIDASGKKRPLRFGGFDHFKHG